MCYAAVSGSTDQPTFIWLDSFNNLVPSGMVSTIGSMSSLIFSPLEASHAGLYTCIARAGGAIKTQTFTFKVNGIISYLYKLANHV